MPIINLCKKQGIKISIKMSFTNNLHGKELTIQSTIRLLFEYKRLCILIKKNNQEYLRYNKRKQRKTKLEFVLTEAYILT